MCSRIGEKKLIEILLTVLIVTIIYLEDEQAHSIHKNSKDK